MLPESLEGVLVQADDLVVVLEYGISRKRKRCFRLSILASTFPRLLNSYHVQRLQPVYPPESRAGEGLDLVLGEGQGLEVS